MTTITDTQPTRLHTGPDDADRCNLCERTYPGHPPPIGHQYVLEAIRPNAVCDCDADHYAATWHQFTCVNSRGILLGAGLCCPDCTIDPGLGAAVVAALVREYTVDLGTN